MNGVLITRDAPLPQDHTASQVMDAMNAVDDDDAPGFGR
jgi:hypothetical protein